MACDMNIAKNNTKDIRSFILFFAGWWMYFTQGVLGLRGTISAVILVMMLVWSMFYYTKVMIMPYKNPVLNALSYLFIIFMIYGLINHFFISENTEFSVEYIKKAAYSILPIFGFYYLFRRLSIDEGWMTVIIIALLLFAIGEYYYARIEFAAKIADGTLKFREDSEMVIGSTYRFLPIIPLLFFITQKEWIKYFVFIVIAVFCILGVKRGPMVICFLSAIIILLDNFSKSSMKKIRFKHIIITIIAFVVGFLVICYYVESNEFVTYRLLQILEGDSSGRDLILERFTVYLLSEYNPFYLLFGHGADSTLRILGNYTHNDWLEIAMNEGLLGFIFYLYYYIVLAKQWRRVKSNHALFMCFGTFILISFITTLISMSINNQRISAHVCLAYCIAMVDNLPIKKII